MTESEKKHIKETVVLPNGLTIAETERQLRDAINQIYLDEWERGMVPKYRDERCRSEQEFIGANADGSEDLLLFDSKNKTFTVLRRLAEPGQGQLDYLTKRLEIANA